MRDELEQIRALVREHMIESAPIAQMIERLCHVIEVQEAALGALTERIEEQEAQNYVVRRAAR